MPLLLELFSGTGSVGRAFRARGWEVFSVDLDAGCKPTLVADVLSLQTEQLPTDVDLIWASPPCTHYSCARTKAKTPRDLVGSDALVRKVLELVYHYMHVDFFMENPHSGLLKSREVVAGIPMQIVDYCKYGKPYRKRTSIWTDSGWVPQRPLCTHDCPASLGTRHTARAQRVPIGGAPRFSRDELYSIPAELCDEIAEYASGRL